MNHPTNSLPNVVYLLGIGGIGMSALARFFKAKGKTIYGYDRTQTSLTQSLEAEGMHIQYADSAAAIPAEVLAAGPSGTLVIYTPAIPTDSIIKNALLSKKYELKKRSEVLGLVSTQYRTLAVAGTHGKTTTSSILAHLMQVSELGCSAFLGGISINVQSNLVLGNSDYLVVEADEYDRSFLTLSPEVAILTSVDADHLDIYGNPTSLLETYIEFTDRVHKRLYVRYGLPIEEHLRCSFLTYDVVDAHQKSEADVVGSITHVSEHGFHFNLRYLDKEINDVVFGFPGRHNLLNAVGAAAVALDTGVTEEELRLGLRSFKGVKRRLEHHIKTHELVYVDDYAHHPGEIKACVSALREMYPTRKITVVFQPHLFSRTRDFAEDFAAELSQVDSLILMDIYPARELPIEGISSAWLLEKVTLTNKKLLPKQEVIAYVKNHTPELLVTMGAGDIDNLVPEIISAFTTDDH